MNVKVIRTAQNSGDRLTEKEPLVLSKKFTTTGNMIAINDTETFQTHVGFGGAFTEASAYTLSEMPEEKRTEAIKAYFDETNGLGYTIGRTHIHSCDFALGNYTYVSEGDKDLETFDMSHEDQWVIPMIKDAMNVKGGEIKLLASPWSPPAFMKTNKEMNHGGQLLPEYYQSWANYYVKYIRGMRERGIDIFTVSVQNEPAAVQTWDSCIYSAEEERDFVKNYLGPTLEKEGLSDIGIVIWDHNRDILIDRASTVLLDDEANKYVWGVGNHWYGSEAFENLSVIHNMFPDKHIIFTEGCQEGGPKPGEWFTGERYGRNIIGDFNNWSEGWIDWNLVLNETGGPNHVQNLCDAPILADRNTKELIYNSSYYYIGQFSRYIRPGAVRIGLSLNTDGLVYATAFKNTDGTIAVVVQNESDEVVRFALTHKGLGTDVELKEHSITTFII
ncbi:glycoside hydrolase family 30 protein [Haloplasma contractile]|uniref:Glycosyl hydrolase protein n=1 Tax=Haloplasma contractile SSD-17B TaxID=1033810 RepID=U2E9T2_9MOLU|nr:glycoside hydrolase family 30 protein [Haloplasma contractile]ERJ11596.1 Glycosyl hydrolase protein [Haloplasma contractile SSD-17B]